MSQHFRPTWAEISLKNVVNNVNEIQKIVGKQTKILSVVKADGYGHGSVQVSQELISAGIDFLAVVCPEEGVVLRRANITVPILVLGPVYPDSNFEVLLDHGLIPTITSLESAEKLIKLVQNRGNIQVPVHVKVDTGMGRVGVIPETLLPIVEKIVKSPLILQGIYAHFSSADCDREYTLNQIKIFDDIIKKISQLNVKVNYYHSANSAGILRFPEGRYSMVRPGLLLYGLLPYPEARKDINIKPVMSLKTRVVFIKKVVPGKKISYGGTFVTKRESVIATLPIGYADGYNRLLSNKGEVLVKGKRAPLVGRVTMDMIMIDVTDVPGTVVGDEVVLIGQQGTETIFAEDLADKIGTINYEIVCNISKRVPRVYV